MQPGIIVLLNGTSSAGKSATARALQRIMEAPYIHTGPDHFLPRVPQQFFTVADESDAVSAEYFQLLYHGVAPRTVAERDGGETVFGLGEFAGLRIGPAGVALLAGMYKGIAAIAAGGVNVIVDDVLHDERLLRATVDAFAGLPVLFVGLHVPLEVAERRERERGDRGPGGAAAFHGLVHAHGIYDLELDTAALTPEECAARIKEALVPGASGRAFSQLRHRFASGDAEVTDNPDARDAEFLGDQIYQFNVASTGIEDGRMLGIMLRDENGTTAGLHGHTWGGVLEIGLLWVREDLRGQGYGSRLLAAAEEEATRRGCSQAILDTHSFQAPEFYLRHGYEIYGEMPDYPKGHSKVFLRKRLRPSDRSIGEH